MSKIAIPEIGPIVYCTYAESFGNEPTTHTNVYGGIAFCANCGDTDHEVIEVAS
jgi:hypothetical protein